MRTEIDMQQLSIFDLETMKNKLLVSNEYMNSLEWKVYNELKKHLTKQNGISASSLASMFDIDTRQLRDVITTLRNKQEAKIIGDDSGYYIGSKQEFEVYIKSRIKRTLSSIKTTLDLSPNAKNIMYWFLNEYENKGIAEGQMQLQFNGWEREFIRQYAEEYIKGEK